MQSRDAINCLQHTMRLKTALTIGNSTYILLRFDHCRYGDHLLTRLTSRHSDILFDNELSSVGPLRKHPCSYELRPNNDTNIHKKTHEAPPRIKAVRSSTKAVAIALPLDVARMLVYLSLSCSDPFLLQRRRYGRQSARKSILPGSRAWT